MLGLKTRIPPPITLNQFLSYIKTDLKNIERILSRKDQFYGYFRIPKKKGGTRPITPALGELKEIQRYTKCFFDECIQWPVYMHGGIKKRSVLTNASYHVKKYMVVNVDIEKCFPNTSDSKVLEALRRIGFEEVLAGLLSEICTYKDCLPQGASTSTCMANIALEAVDRRLLSFFKRHKFFYTRFVDDITLSGDIDLRPFKNVLYDTIEEAEYSISKYSVASRAETQVVTGLRVNEKIRPTREFIQRLKDDIRSGWQDDNRIEFTANDYGLTIQELRSNILGRVNFVRSIDNKLGRELKGLMVKVVWPEKHTLN